MLSDERDKSLKRIQVSARKIQNKLVVNQFEVSKELNFWRQQHVAIKYSVEMEW